MPICPSCGASNDEGLKFCVTCGTTLAPDPGAWRAGTDELNRQSAGAASSPPESSYAAPPPPVSYAASPSGALSGQLTGAAAQMNYALWADRVVAALLDALVIGVGLIALYAVITVGSLLLGAIGAGIGGAIGGEDGAGPGTLLGSSLCCIAFVLLPIVSFGVGLYNKVYLVSKRGASIGQGLVKLKVVTAQGSLVPTGTLLLRLLVQVGFGFIPFLPLLSILWPLWDPQRQALHDKAVGTFVVKAG
jgi:uncharacterized RDD family membrane protein YckC